MDLFESIDPLVRTKELFDRVIPVAMLLLSFYFLNLSMLIDDCATGVSCVRVIQIFRQLREIHLLLLIKFLDHLLVCLNLAFNWYLELVALELFILRGSRRLFLKDRRQVSAVEIGGPSSDV